MLELKLKTIGIVSLMKKLPKGKEKEKDNEKERKRTMKRTWEGKDQ